MSRELGNTQTLLLKSFQDFGDEDLLRRARTPVEVEESLRRGNARVTNKTALHWYKSRFAVPPAEAPTGPHTWAPEVLGRRILGGYWLHVCSFFAY